MIKPIPNINGSGANDLIAPRMKAYTSIEDAITHLTKACPHGRDYPLAPERCEADRKAHFKRLQALAKISKGILEESIAIRQSFDEYGRRATL